MIRVSRNFSRILVRAIYDGLHDFNFDAVSRHP